MGKIISSVNAKLLLDFGATMGIDVMRCIDRYGNECVEGLGVTKAQIFQEVASGQVSATTAGVLYDRCDLPFLRDRRSPIEYGSDLVLGWLAEDLFAELSKSIGVEVVRSGADSEREFLGRHQISTDPDFLGRVGSKVAPIELVVSWTTYWTRTNRWDLREGKFRKLQSEPNVILFCMDLPARRAASIPFSSVENGFQPRANPAWGGKRAMTLNGMEARLVDTRVALAQMRDSIAGSLPDA